MRLKNLSVIALQYTVTLLLFCFCISALADTTFQGQNIQSLVARWGQPDEVIHTREGYTYYTFSIKHNNPMYAPPSTQSNVIVAGGHAIGVPTPRTTIGNTTLLLCTMIFKVNSHNIIVSTSSHGPQCGGAEDFSRRITSPYN